MQFLHIVVAVCFCPDRGGGDGEVFTVAFDHTGMFYTGVWFEPVAVDKQVLRFWKKQGIRWRK